MLADSWLTVCVYWEAASHVITSTLLTENTSTLTLLSLQHVWSLLTSICRSTAGCMRKLSFTLHVICTFYLQNDETEKHSDKIGLDTILLFKILSILIAQSNFYDFQLWDDLLPVWRESVYSSVIYVPSSKLFFVALTLTAHIRETGSHH